VSEQNEKRTLERESTVQLVFTELLNRTSLLNNLHKLASNEDECVATAVGET